MHTHSMLAYKEAFELLSKRRKKIYRFLLKRGEALTDKQIRTIMFGPDAVLGMVQPRITELIQFGFLEEVDPARSVKTGIYCRKVKALTAEEVERKLTAPKQEPLDIEEPENEFVTCGECVNWKKNEGNGNYGGCSTILRLVRRVLVEVKGDLFEKPLYPEPHRNFGCILGRKK